MSISRSTIRSNVFTDVYAVVNTNVTDPLIRGKQWIFSSNSIFTSPDFIGYPVIIISNADISSTYPTFKNDAEYSTVITVSIYTTSKVMLDQLSDQVSNLFTITNFPQFTFLNNGSEVSNEQVSNNTNIYIKTINRPVSIEGGW